MIKKSIIKFKIILSVIVSAFALTVEAANAEVMVIQANQEKFVVRLPSNPTTGYQLTVKSYDEQALKLVDQQFIAPTSKLIGAGGEVKFTFQRLNPTIMSTEIYFQYAHPWEGPTPGSSKVVKVQFK